MYLCIHGMSTVVDISVLRVFCGCRDQDMMENTTKMIHKKKQLHHSYKYSVLRCITVVVGDLTLSGAFIKVHRLRRDTGKVPWKYSRRNSRVNYIAL